MKRISAAIAAALLLGACGRNEADDFRTGVPRAEMVRMEVPQKRTSALTEGVGQSQDELRGEHSGFYDLTRGATLIVNGGAVAVLGLVKAITDHPPTSVRGNEATWGPHTEALSPNTWKLTVTRTGGRSYSYVLEGKPKSAADSAYVVVLSGTHQAGESQGVGNGTFLLDWDEAQKLPEHDNNVGTADFTYARTAAGAVTVSTKFTQVKDGASGNLIDADYRYGSTPGSGGTFEFATQKNLDTDPSRSAAERLTIKSRWKETGAGRSDVKVSGGDLTTPATANECWDTNFNSMYLNLSFDPSKNYGNEATDCAFIGADYSNL